MWVSNIGLCNSNSINPKVEQKKLNDKARLFVYHQISCLCLRWEIDSLSLKITKNMHFYVQKNYYYYHYYSCMISRLLLLLLLFIVNISFFLMIIAKNKNVSFNIKGHKFYVLWYIFCYNRRYPTIVQTRLGV